MKKSLRALTATVLFTVTLGGSNAFAAVLFGSDDVNYAASHCQPATAADSNRVRYFLGTARNVSTTDVLTLECPLHKDEFNSAILSGNVAVVDRRTDAKVSCVFRSMSALNGAALATVATRAVATLDGDASANAVHLSIGGLADPGISGYYTMDCRVPAALPGQESMILFYRVEED